MLGTGAPSPAVEVNLHAFLGHLRAHARAGHYQGTSPAASSSSLVTTAPHSFLPSSVELLDTGATATATADGSSRAQSAKVLSCSEQQPVRLAGTSGLSKETQQQRVQQMADQMHAEPSPNKASARKSAPAAGANTDATIHEAFFGDDFLGLRSYGEERVHSLFGLGAVSSSSSLRRARAADRGVSHITAAAPAGPSSTMPSALSPRFLPSIVDSAVSGEKWSRKKGYVTGRKSSPEAAFVGPSPGGGGVGESDDRVVCGVDGAALGLEFPCNNEVFHAVLNIGKRLPGRLRRDRPGSVQ